MLRHENTICKVYAMYADNATTFNEKETAIRKLHKLCKKHKVNLSNLIDNCSLNIDYSVKQQAAASEVHTKRKAMSRRALIINMLHDNVYSKNDIAQVLCEVYNIADFKTNKKAVSGTLYDLQTNKSYFDYKVCKSDRLVCNFHVVA